MKQINKNFFIQFASGLACRPIRDVVKDEVRWIVRDGVDDSLPFSAAQSIQIWTWLTIPEGWNDAPIDL